MSKRFITTPLSWLNGKQAPYCEQARYALVVSCLFPSHAFFAEPIEREGRYVVGLFNHV
ncbi:MAG: hypothetical protein R3B95_12265 [Nitrospirales bacterium]|nr:hypothetical protein [Nitrospirales bacterium]